MKIRKISRINNKLFKAVLRLLPQLSPESELPSRERVETILKAEGTQFFIAELDNKEIAGILTLITYDLLSGIKVWIEDVVVDESQRGKGIGKELVLFAIAFARSHGAKTVELTSRSSRIAANQLYLKIGFSLRETNVYRYTLK